jgi:hypothetical protein
VLAASLQKRTCHLTPPRSGGEMKAFFVCFRSLSIIGKIAQVEVALNNYFPTKSTTHSQNHAAMQQFR